MKEENCYKRNEKNNSQKSPNFKAIKKTKRENTQSKSLDSFLKKILLIVITHIMKPITTASLYIRTETALIQSVWLYNEVHTLPANCEGFQIDTELAIYYPGTYTYPTTWSSIIDPIIKLQLNKPGNAGADFDGSEFVLVKVEGILSGGYLYYRLVLEVRDSTGVLYSQNTMIDTSSDYVYNPIFLLLKVRTNPLEVTLRSSLKEDHYYNTPIMYRSASNHEIEFKDAAELRVGLNIPYPDFNVAPYGGVMKYKTEFYSLNQPYVDAFDREYRNEMERFYLQTTIPDIVQDKIQIHEFDLTPENDFDVETVAKTFIYSATTIFGERMGMECINGCKFVKNPLDQSYQVYIKDGEQIKISLNVKKTVYGGTGYEAQYSYFYYPPIIQKSYIYWFKLAGDPGIHECTTRNLIYMLGVTVTLDLSNNIAVNGVQSNVKILRDRWYAFGISNMRDTFTYGVNKTLTRIIVQDLSDNKTEVVEVKSTVNYENSFHERFGGRECGVDAFLKYVVSTQNYLAKPTPNCPFNFFINKSPNWDLSCVYDLMATVPENLKVYDQNIYLLRRDYQDCQKLEVKASGKCSCSPGSTLVQDPITNLNKCSCQNKTKYYDFKTWQCSPCPVNQFVKDNDYECQELAKNEVEYVYHFIEETSQLKLMFTNSTLPSDFLEVYESGKLKSRFEVAIPDKIESIDYNYTFQFGAVEQKDAVIFLNFEFYSEMDYEDISVRIFSSQSIVKPVEANFKTGPRNGKYNTFGAIAEKVNPESVQMAESTLFLASVFLPSIFEKMPFILFFFSFLRTLNYYPVKIPENLHKFLSSFYIDYRNTYGYKIVNNLVREAQNKDEDYFIDPPKFKVENRHNIYVSRVLYFSNTIPVISVISKIGLIWYLVKVFRQLKTATITKITKIEHERKNRSCFKKFMDFVFRKIITFMIIKIHIDVYGRLIFIFAAFGGFMEVMRYNKVLCFLNICEALLDFTVIIWVEIKIYTFLKGSKTVQLLMLDVQRLKSVLMVNIFKKGSDNSHSATYLCIQNFCIFLLASTLIVFQKFVEMMFFIHIIIMLFLLSYCFLMKNMFKNKIDFFIYFSNNLGFCLIVIMFSFFMYYEEYEVKTVALFGFLIQIGIILLMISKMIFLFLKFLRMYLNWRERKKRGSLVKSFVLNKHKEMVKKKKQLGVGKKKAIRPPTYDELGMISVNGSKIKNGINSGGSSSQLFKFVMSKNISKNVLGSIEELNPKKIINTENPQKSEENQNPNRLSIKLRRGSIRSKRNSIMSISSRLQQVPKLSKLGAKLASPTRKRRKSKTQTPGSRNDWDLEDVTVKEKKKKKSSLKEIDDDLFAQLQKIHDDELNKRETKGGNLNKLNSKGTFSSHSSEYFDEDGKNSIIENSLKFQRQNSPETVSPLASPKNLRNHSFGGFKLAVNGIGVEDESPKIQKFAPSLNDLKKYENIQEIDIRKKPKIAKDNRHHSIVASRNLRQAGSGLFGLKERIQLRRGSLRLNFKEDPAKKNDDKLVNSHRAKTKHSTFASSRIKSQMNGDEAEQRMRIELERTPSPSHFKRNNLKLKQLSSLGSVLKLQELKEEDESRIESVVFEDE